MKTPKITFYRPDDGDDPVLPDLTGDPGGTGWHVRVRVDSWAKVELTMAGYLAAEERVKTYAQHIARHVTQKLDELGYYDQSEIRQARTSEVKRALETVAEVARTCDREHLGVLMKVADELRGQRDEIGEEET